MLIFIVIFDIRKKEVLLYVKNIVNDIEKNCPDKTPQGIVTFLIERNDFSYTCDYYREVWKFYQESISLFPKNNQQRRRAREHTLEMFGISIEVFRRARKKKRASENYSNRL